MPTSRIPLLTLTSLLALTGCSSDKLATRHPQYTTPSKAQKPPDLIKLGRPNDFTTVYMATRSIQRRGSVVQVWQFAIHDYPVPLGNLGSTQSSEAKVAFNCTQKTQALLQSRTFSDPAGKRPIGEPLNFADKPDAYKPVKAGSVAAKALSVVCSPGS